MVQNEKEIVKYLNIPSIPKKKWDGKKSFKNGCAVTQLLSGGEAYAVATFDTEKDTKPRIVKVFAQDIFKGYTDIFVVPSYMDDVDIDNADLDDESKKKMSLLMEEAKELESDGVEESQEENTNEYYFANITNDDEARAYIKAYNKRNKIRANIPKQHDAIVMRLSVIWNEENNK